MSGQSRKILHRTGLTEFCRGAWDTLLGLYSKFQEAPYSELAMFPDGRYAFRVNALSQGSAFLSEEYQQWATRDLPSEDPLDPNADVVGIVVDNFKPFVKTVIVFSIEPKFKQYYAAKWTLDPSSLMASSTL